MGAPAPPQSGEKNFFSPNLQEKCVSAPPSQFLKEIFRTVFCWVGLDLEVYLDGLCGRRLKKGRQLFWPKN